MDEHQTSDSEKINPHLSATPRHRTFRQRWATMSLPNQLMAAATIVIAVATLTSMGIAYLQYSEMNASGKQTDKLIDLYGSQLAAAQANARAALDQATTSRAQAEEMKASGADTHELAVQAKNQADNTDKLARAASDQVSKLKDSVAEAHQLALTTGDAVSLTRQAQTAWVGILNPTLNSVTYEYGNIVMHGTFVLRNFGISPATRVVPYVASSTNWDGMETAELGACSAAKSQFEQIDKAVREAAKNRDIGNTIFPGQELTHTFMSVAVNPKARTGYLFSVGCIYYRDTLKQTRKTEFCLYSPDAVSGAGVPIERCPWSETAE
jgi:hypothetical protein